MDELTKLAIKYGTDKWGKHSYTPYYYKLFKHKRDKVKKVVEIGVAEGFSLKMWHDFFPNAKIYGAEIDPKRVHSMTDYPRVEIIKCDQTSYDSLNDLLWKTGFDIDLFIDDATHKPSDQLATFFSVFPSLNKNVIYIIEDVSEKGISIPILGYKWEQKSRFDVKVIECSKKRHDDRLIIVRHKL